MDMDEPKGDVRSVCVLETEDTTRVVAGSKDGQIYCWKKRKKTDTCYTLEYTASTTYSPIYSVAAIQPTDEYGEGLVVSGDETGLISVHTPHCPASILYTLIGHESTVSALFATADGRILSGSWDTTAIVWAGWQKKHLLAGHTGSVLGIAASTDGTVLTSSADKTVRVWRDGTCTGVIDCGADCMREIVFLDRDLAAVASNDSLVRIVSVSQTGVVKLLAEHSEYVYTVAANDDFVCSGGEDGRVSFWNRSDYSLHSVSRFPCTVWSVCFVDRDTVAVGRGDNVLSIQPIDEPREQGPKTPGEQETDFSFSVDAEGTAHSLQCNRGDNPAAVADSFVLEKKLPKAFAEQIISFLVKNTPSRCLCGAPASGRVACCNGCGVYFPSGPVALKEAEREKMLETISSSNSEKKAELAGIFAGIAAGRISDTNRAALLSLLEETQQESLFAVFDLVRLAVLAPAFLDRHTLGAILARAEAEEGRLERKTATTIARTLCNIVAAEETQETLSDDDAERLVQIAEKTAPLLKRKDPALFLLHNLALSPHRPPSLAAFGKTLERLCTTHTEIDFARRSLQKQKQKRS
ncbi:MAG: WD repeat protein Lub1 [Amphiamblys sp. WSBS2006]|nr:MAG: WD repeat protein Lub1 [Amphiamblys sp. WSBS2006]